jgi:hypothetical protein
MIRGDFSNTLKVHWFVCAAVAVLAGDALMVLVDGWSAPALIEFGLLFDLVIVIPALYAWCYRNRGIKTLWRALALACLGMWAAGAIVPDRHHDLIDRVYWARYLALGVLLVIEIKFMVAVYRAAFAREPDEARMRAAADAAGLPPWATKMMAWEAGLWRKAWFGLRRLLGRE